MTEHERIDAMAKLMIQVGESLGRLAAAISQLHQQDVVAAETLRQHGRYLMELHEFMSDGPVASDHGRTRLDGLWGNPN